ncbi:Beta-lactamase protein [Apis cerana cerana]|uniref:Beta-lactamase-like protein 2 homolog n=1 Tax=Apis cerana cerana TaxID=94128 RepID=A0A2A3EII5_APICC|nr:Beta-lactamase protein [Apis cerana cerana]
MKKLTHLPLITRLSKNVIRILGCNKGFMTLQGTNSYLVGTGNRRILIDTTEKKNANDYIKLLHRVLEEEKATIEHLLITHWHFDHLGAVNSVLNMLKTINTEIKSTVWKFSRTPNDKNSRNMENLFEWKQLRDKQIIEVEGAKLDVEYTPGHATDHASFMMEDEKILFSGDCILGEGTAVFEDLNAYIATLKKMLMMKPKVIYPGHGPIIENPENIINFYIENRLKRENDILNILEQNAKNNTLSELDIVNHLYTVMIIFSLYLYLLEYKMCNRKFDVFRKFHQRI